MQRADTPCNRAKKNQRRFSCLKPFFFYSNRIHNAKVQLPTNECTQSYNQERTPKLHVHMVSRTFPSCFTEAEMVPSIPPPAGTAPMGPSMTKAMPPEYHSPFSTPYDTNPEAVRPVVVQVWCNRTREKVRFERNDEEAGLVLA